MTPVHPRSGQNWADGAAWTSNRASTIGALLIFVAAASLDLFVMKLNFAVVLAVPLLLLAGGSSSFAQILRYVALAVITIYAVYYLKYQVITTGDGTPFVSYRLFNRTFVTVSLGLLALLSQGWLYWRYEWTLLDYLDRCEEGELNSTAGIVGCLGLAALIAAVDFVTPANYNLAILFIIPVYLSSWLHDRRILWGTTIALISWVVIDFLISHPVTVPGLTPWIIAANRAIVILTLLILAGILHARMGERDEPTLWREPETWYR